MYPSIRIPAARLDYMYSDGVADRRSNQRGPASYIATGLEYTNARGGRSELQAALNVRHPQPADKERIYSSSSSATPPTLYIRRFHGEPKAVTD